MTETVISQNNVPVRLTDERGAALYGVPLGDS